MAGRRVVIRSLYDTPLSGGRVADVADVDRDGHDARPIGRRRSRTAEAAGLGEAAARLRGTLAAGGLSQRNATHTAAISSTIRSSFGSVIIAQGLWEADNRVKKRQANQG